MTTTNTMHDASNKVISSFITKQELALDTIIAFAGNSPEGTKLDRRPKQLQFSHTVNDKRIFSIFVRYEGVDGYRINAYEPNGIEKYDFRNVQSYHDAVAIIKLIAFRMKHN